MIRIPYPTPPEFRSRLMAAGKMACLAMAKRDYDAWRRHHAQVEEITAEIFAKHGTEEV